MRLLIAETGYPPEPLRAEFGSYPKMAEDVLSGCGPLSVTTVDVMAGALLPGPETADALLIMGSPAGVYEPHPWIAPFEDAIRDWAASDRSFAGICFGHQIIAKALGGVVEKSPKGWGAGVHSYTVVSSYPGWDEGPERLACAVSHQDQVIELPPGAVRVAGSAFCLNGIIAYPEARGLTYQPHPDFTHTYGRALLDLRTDKIGADVAAFGQETYRRESDRGLLAQRLYDHLSAGSV